MTNKWIKLESKICILMGIKNEFVQNIGFLDHKKLKDSLWAKRLNVSNLFHWNIIFQRNPGTHLCIFPFTARFQNLRCPTGDILWMSDYFRTLCTILSHVAFSPTVAEFRWGHVSPIETESLYELHCQFTSTYPIYSTCPTDACIIRCMVPVL